MLGLGVSGVGRSAPVGEYFASRVEERVDSPGRRIRSSYEREETAWTQFLK